MRGLALLPELPSAAAPEVSDRFEGDTPHLRLKNWLTLFEDEIDEVLDARDRVVHGVRLSDRELRASQWLASHLLELVDTERSAVIGDT